MERDDDWGDPTRRTHLANERTYLAWWRTGLTAFAVAVGVGRLVPELTHRRGGSVSAAAGICFALFGAFVVVYGTIRTRRVRTALERNEFSHPDPRVLAALAAAAVLLGCLTLAIVVRAL